MDTQLNSGTLEFREKHPMCTFCKNARMEFFRIVCTLDKTKTKPCAKNCPNYIPTLEPIEKRSPY